MMNILKKLMFVPFIIAGGVAIGFYYIKYKPDEVQWMYTGFLDGIEYTTDCSMMPMQNDKIGPVPSVYVSRQKCEEVAEAVGAKMFEIRKWKRLTQNPPSYQRLGYIFTGGEWQKPNPPYTREQRAQFAGEVRYYESICEDAVATDELGNLVYQSVRPLLMPRTVYENTSGSSANPSKANPGQIYIKVMPITKDSDVTVKHGDTTRKFKAADSSWAIQEANQAGGFISADNTLNDVVAGDVSMIYYTDPSTNKDRMWNTEDEITKAEIDNDDFAKGSSAPYIATKAFYAMDEDDKKKVNMPPFIAEGVKFVGKIGDSTSWTKNDVLTEHAKAGTPDRMVYIDITGADSAQTLQIWVASKYAEDVIERPDLLRGTEKTVMGRFKGAYAMNVFGFALDGRSVVVPSDPGFDSNTVCIKRGKKGRYDWMAWLGYSLIGVGVIGTIAMLVGGMLKKPDPSLIEDISSAIAPAAPTVAPPAPPVAAPPAPPAAA